MEHFTPVSSLAGGFLIGISATAMLALLGRVAGVSGIVGQFLSGDRRELAWRAAFVAGLVVGGASVSLLRPEVFATTLERSPLTLAAAGLLVGFGSRLGSGCTSGHGVCGLARASRRSLVATVVFIASGAVTVFVASCFGAST